MKNAPSFFHVRRIDNRWWFIDPQGRRFISKGVTSVRFDQDKAFGTDVSPYAVTNTAKYGTIENWRHAAAARLLGWGFNTLGARSDEKVSQITVNGRRLTDSPILDLGATFVAQQGQGHAWLDGVFPDVFDPGFEATARREAKRLCAPRASDPWLLGWFTDNEMRWGADWRGRDDLLSMFLKLPDRAPGKKVARALAPDNRAFLARLAQRYFRVCREAILAADPNHMIFGCCFAYVPAGPVAQAAAKYLDAISINCYEPDPRSVIESYKIFGRPMIIGEYSFRADDTGLYNTKGAGKLVKNQAQRAAAYEHYLTLALQNPNVIGHHWFQHTDEPKVGRPDGENSNYGLVNIKDKPYLTLTRTMRRMHAREEVIHQTAKPRRQIPAATHEGLIAFPGGVVRCFVLGDAQRVVERASWLSALGTSEKALAARNLSLIIDAETLAAHTLKVHPPTAKSPLVCLSADGALSICRTLVAALEAKTLTRAQMPMAWRSVGIIDHCAKSGLDTLIAESTGAQYDCVPAAMADSLQKTAGLAAELRRWESCYPGVAWGEFDRLSHCQRQGKNRPHYYDALMEETVYAHLPPDVIRWLKMHDPIPPPSPGVTATMLNFAA